MGEQKRILISGGWGYGNLGDDVILDSTIRLVHKFIPNSKQTVMSYDTEETGQLLSGDYDVVPSIHRYLDFNLSHVFLGSIDRAKFRLSRIPKKIIRNAINIKIRLFPRLSMHSKHKFEDIFSKHEIFLQTGGGYFNGKWPISALAHALELEIAAKMGLKILLMGQSIGGFSDHWLEKRVLSALKLAHKIAVRDEQSSFELSESGINNSILPDLAMERYLSSSNPELRKQQEIGLILKNVKPLFMEKLSAALANDLFKQNMKIKVIVSRNWRNNILVANQMLEYLKSSGLNCYIIIPDTWKTLNNEISTCCLVLSQTFHGLILSVCSGIPILAINEHDKGSVESRKIESFMLRMSQEKMVINSQTSFVDILGLLNEARRSRVIIKKNGELLSKQVLKNVEIILKKISA